MFNILPTGLGSGENSFATIVKWHSPPASAEPQHPRQGARADTRGHGHVLCYPHHGFCSQNKTSPLEALYQKGSSTQERSYLCRHPSGEVSY